MVVLKDIDELNFIIDSTLNEHIDLVLIFKEFDNNKLESFINFYLDRIKNITNKVINIKICDSILEYFDYNYNVSDSENRTKNYGIMEEANIICDDLVKKITNSNERSITLPISLNNIIDYSISSYINSEDINKVIYYILIKLSIIYNFYK